MDHEVTTVFIVDDQPVFRLGLRTALDQAEDISVLGETALTEEAVDLVCSFQPRVALVGTAPPRHRGLDLCRRISQRAPELPVILMTPTEDTGELFEAIKSGAWGYVSKLADVGTIVKCIRKVCQGEMPLQETMASHPEVGRRLLEEFQTMARNPRMRDVMAPLSQREMELLRQLGQGRSNKEIAHTLNITAQTVKNHITSILRKLDVNDRTQAVLAGLRYGWITLDDVSTDGDKVDFSLPSRR
ncbi:MAG: response regulator transcription factor [Chloroflexi bacterium]|nr:response regulator transcription factor [Chloroflexota bacterium]